jgi:tetratricopeptide (TPR) repeat protein
VVAKVSLETNEALFAVMLSLNQCGLDSETDASTDLRRQIRSEVQGIVQSSAEAIRARDELCNFVKAQKQADPARELSQYVSLALHLTPPPFSLTIKQGDLPPDALNLVGFLPFLQSFYDAAGLHAVWSRHQAEYDALVARLHDPVAEMIFRNDLYLKLAFSGYAGRRFLVFVEPMGLPSQVNARNYRDDYFLVITPGQAPLRMEEIRHTYLHYVLDPLALKSAGALKRLDPLRELAQHSALDESYKQDTSLLVIESLIRAIEARTLPVESQDPKALEVARAASAQSAMEQGFVLAGYFNEALREFEKDPIGIRDAFSDMLREISLPAETRRISQIRFSSTSAQDIIRAPRRRKVQLLDLAEERLTAGDAPGAVRLAKRVLDEKIAGEDPGRALFVLARAATLERRVDDAQLMFERAIELSQEPRTSAWSHIHLARILDLRCNRDAALAHYKAALGIAQITPDIKAAAEKGVAAPPLDRCEKDVDDKD